MNNPIHINDLGTFVSSLDKEDEYETALDILFSLDKEDEYETALDILFDKIEEACKAAGLDIQIEFEDDPGPIGECGQWSVGMWIEGGMVKIYGGEIAPNEDDFNKFLKWAQIEKATSIEELPEGLADDDFRIREKAEQKKIQLEIASGKV